MMMSDSDGSEPAGVGQQTQASTTTTVGARDSVDAPVNPAAEERRRQRVLLWFVRLLFVVLLITVTVLATAYRDGGDPSDFSWPTVIGLFIASSAIAFIVVLVDTLTPHKRLSAVVGVYMGLCAGLIGTLAFAALADAVASGFGLDVDPSAQYVDLIKVVVGIILCYLGVSIVLTTKDDFRLVIPYVEFAKQVRGVRPMALDTSALIDGRIERLAHTGFLDAPLIVPQFVVDELQTLSDSADRLKRNRGRRGLDLVRTLQANPLIDITIDDTEVEGISVDRMLIELASQQNLRILTTDYNLNKVAEIRGVSVLNMNDLANTLRPEVVPGESLRLRMVKPGEGEDQGVGYLADGTMVVVENGAKRIGDEIDVVVTNSLQTSAGRMIFAKVEGEDDGDDDHPSAAPRMARAATNQPRATGSAPRRRR